MSAMRHPWVGVEEGLVPVHALGDPVIPEPSRYGEGDKPHCTSCAAARSPDNLEVYRDDLWRVRLHADTAFAGTCMLSPLRHCDGVSGLDAHELAAYGPMIARITQALMDRPAGGPGFGDGRVGRVHSHLWNDGGAHLHQWFFPRPLGYLDLLGSVLVEWEETLPRASENDVLAAAADLRTRLGG
jgi:diadenosine tetraphosphate (Ap4A) HIT family hydrolase